MNKQDKVTAQTFRDVFKSIEEFAERYRAEIYPDKTVESIYIGCGGKRDHKISIVFEKHSYNNYCLDINYLDIDSSDWDNKEETFNKAIHSRDNAEEELALYKELHKKYGDK